MYYIGIDLGTSAVKLLLMDETGSIANIVSREYPIAFPHPGWSEQDPADWWAAVCDGIPALLDGFDASQVKGIGAGGQMHGLVVLDKNDVVIRPCILWNEWPHPKAGRLLKRRYRQRQAEPLHRKHRLCRLHRTQTALDAGERAGQLRPHRKNHAAEGLHQL